MNALLVFSTVDAAAAECPLGGFGEIHLGLSYVSSVLRARGHTTRLAVLSSGMEKASARILEGILADFRPQMVCFTAVSTQYDFICRMARRARAVCPRAYRVVGGVHVSLNPRDEVLDTFDALCIGEGEFPTAELADQLERGQEPDGIPNLWLRSRAGEIRKNPVRDFLQDLDALPVPDREMWRPWVRDRDGASQVMLVARGCPFLCTYCCNHALRKVAHGKYVRFRSPRNILEEVSALRAEWPSLREVGLQVETIALDKTWMKELCRELRRYNDTLPRPLEYSCNFRIAHQYMDEELFAALAAANVRTIEIGLESGSERIRREVLKRDYSNEDFLKIVGWARARGMKVNIYNMVGVPGETLEDHMETVRINRLCCPDRSNTSIFFPYPGTELYDLCRRQGLLQGEIQEGQERRRAVLDLPGFPAREIQRAYQWFEYRIYKGHRSLAFRLRKVVRNKIAASFALQNVFLRLLPVWHRLSRRRAAGARGGAG